MKRRNWSWLVVVACMVAAGVACDEEAVFEPPENEEPEDTLRNSTTSLIEQHFTAAYTSMDSAAYEEALDASYQFQLLPEDVDPDNPDQAWWDKTTEMIIAGNMFSGRPSGDGQEVRFIDLALDERLTVVDNDAYEQKPAGETWYRVTTSVDLQVVVEDPRDQEGYTNYMVLSEQIFICRPDPDDGEKWVIFRQLDQPFINKNRAAGTQDSSWGKVKNLFRDRSTGKAGVAQTSWGSVKALFR